MASSKVMASSTNSANSDLTRQSSSSIYSLTIAERQSSVSLGDPNRAFGSMSMDELLRNIYPDNPTAEIIPPHESNGGGSMSLSRQESFSLPKTVGAKTVDEVWQEISGDRKMEATEGPVFNEEMTLEDFLAKAGAVREEDVRVPALHAGFPVDLSNRFQQQQQQPMEGSSNLGFRNGVEGTGGGGGGRGKRRALVEPVDRVAQQRQRRMIKNRESAARSRERKQAYTVELESLVTRLEEENARLVKQQMEQTKKRLKQLMENLIPVLEARRPPRVLRRTRSMNW